MLWPRQVVIKNLDTGQTLVTHDLNFAKQDSSQGNDCCVKVYTFDKSKTHYGDGISAKVTGGGGSWESRPYNYKNNLRMSIDLDEIGDDESNNNNNGSNDSDDNICDSDPETTAPSCEDFEKEFQLGE